MAEITIYTASTSLQGKEVRSKFDSTFATLYRHLDDGFQPINFMLPGLPLPQNRRRDHAQRVMEELYADIIRRRRREGNREGETDMIWTLMDARYKDGTAVPDAHVARLMIALLMGGQHNTAASGAWVALNLAHKPRVIGELHREQSDALGSAPLTWEGLQALSLNAKVIRETLRLHSPIHSILREVKAPMRVPGTAWVVPPTHALLASPGVPARDAAFFPRPLEWDPHRWDGARSTERDDEEGEAKVDYGFGLVSKAVGSPYLPFGAGRHRCVGEQYAYAQLGAIVATMVRLLEWEQVDPLAPVPATDYSSMFSRPMNPAVIRWRRRK